MNNPKTPLLIMALGALLLLAHIAYFYPFMADDSFISLRYAERLLHGKGLTWNDGEHVEGYSNLLWVLLSAGLGALGAGLQASAQFMGIASAMLTLPALAFHARDAKLGVEPLLAGVIAFAVISPVAIWGTSGMETPLVMLLFAWTAAWCYRLITVPDARRALLAGSALALICLLRPEGPVYVIAVAASLMGCSLLAWRQRMRMAAIICAVPFSCWLMQLAFRLYYYGQWFPNTVMAKVAFTPERLENGFSYVVQALYFFLPLLLYAIINIHMAHKKRVETPLLRFSFFLLAAVSVISLAVAIEGGDFFPCFRAFIPLSPLIVLLLMQGVFLGMKYAPLKKELMFLGYVLAAHLWLQFDCDANHSPKDTHWVDDAKQIGLALKQKYSKTQPLIAVFAAGAVPFYSELPALDVFGLNDVYLTTHRRDKSTFGKGIIGHELFDGSYIESKKPDILVFDIPGFYPLCSGFETECAKLLPKYKPAVLHIPGQDIKIWLRKDSRKVN